MSNPMVLMETSMGDVLIELYADKAPETVANFLSYVDDGHYEGLTFHRVIANFMIQGGGYTMMMKEKPTRAPIKNEASLELKNTVGTLAMARTSDPHSATCQFFINVVDNPFLDFTEATTQGYGYAVFGKVSEGMEVVEKIRKVRTKTFGPFSDVPADPVTIVSVSRFEV
jgi:peptidyl-prolyl cis-trans isomerase B (cyclophilin B)